MPGPTHNLNIQEYSLDEVLELFDLHDYNFTIEDLKKAKRKVLQNPRKCWRNILIHYNEILQQATRVLLGESHTKSTKAKLPQK